MDGSIAGTHTIIDASIYCFSGSGPVPRCDEVESVRRTYAAIGRGTHGCLGLFCKK